MAPLAAFAGRSSRVRERHRIEVKLKKQTLQQLSKAELYDRAQKAGVGGRSQMGKEELINALTNGSSKSDHSTTKRSAKGRRSSVTKHPKPAPTSQRSIWSGAITFGLITIPVGLYTATEDRDISFHQLSGKDHSRIEYKRVSSKTGREVDWDDIVKGFEYEEGKFVVFTPEEIKQIAPESSRTIDVVQFVEAAEIDPIYFERSYFVAPTKVAVKAYTLFTRALEESDRVALAKVAIREKERLCALRVRDDMLVLETMNWPDEIREPKFDQLKTKPRVSSEELKMARLLIDQLTAAFDPTRFEDSYRQRLQEAIDSKINGDEITVTAAEAPSAKVTDLLEALKASVDQTRAKRSA
jgi:DNA end-binding protein Ku